MNQCRYNLVTPSLGGNKTMAATNEERAPGSTSANYSRKQGPDYGYGEDNGPSYSSLKKDPSHGYEHNDEESLRSSDRIYGHGGEGRCSRSNDHQSYSSLDASRNSRCLKTKNSSNSHKRMQRRLSAGAMSCCSAYSNYSLESHCFTGDGHTDTGSGLMTRSKRRSSLSSSIHSVNSASSAGFLSSSQQDGESFDGIVSIEGLKERGKKHLKPKTHANRRASLSSIHTTSSSQCSLSLHLENNEFVSSAHIGQDALSAECSLGAFSNDATEISGVDSAEAMFTAHHSSAETLPFTNIVPNSSEQRGSGGRGKQGKSGKRKASYKQNRNRNTNKKDHIIESLVWFSFHLPRTVLEDLIVHELEVWKRAHDNLLLKASSSKRGSVMKRTRNSMKTLLTTSNHGLLSGGDKGDASMSSLSDDGGTDGAAIVEPVFASGYSENLMLRERGKKDTMIQLPKAIERQAAILFVDMSGFTKLSTVMDVESLSKVINSYFDMIVSEVIYHGGDILKFAGDAFFAEWRVSNSSDDSDDDADCDSKKKNPLSDLNASLASISEMVWDDSDVPPLSNCVMMASKCATSIVNKFSDYRVSTATHRNVTNAELYMLNVHCGVGVGNLVGLHVGDYKDGQEEDAIELRREFLLLGEPIDQVAKAAEKAADGEVYASPEALLSLGLVCDLTDDQRFAEEPILIASRTESFLKYDVGMEDFPENTAMQPYESLRMHCKSLNHAALQRLNLQMALYVHPVIREDELALSAAIQAGKISQPTETLESRHRAEAELRSVYTMFISPIIIPRITGIKLVDEELYTTLGNIMYVTSRELDRYSGHLRQFIVDDKGVVLIATFGLRGSTFPNMVENNCLPATFAIHRALKNELKIESRIGATFGKVYCGVVGGLRRHEFACMGAPVNLAARLMGSKENQGILVDEAVGEQCRAGYTFKRLPPVKAKGYAKPVPILEPMPEVATKSKKKKSSLAFTGRKVEQRTILSVAHSLLEEPEVCQSSICFLSGESGSGKSRLVGNVLEELKKKGSDEKKIIVTARSSSTETEQRIPLSSYRKIFLEVIRVRCDHDNQYDAVDRKATERTLMAASQGTHKSYMSPLKSTRAMSRRSGFRDVANKEGANSHRKFFLVKPEQGSLHGKRVSGSQHKSRARTNISVHGKLSQSLHGALNQSNHGEQPKGVRSPITKPEKRESASIPWSSFHQMLSTADRSNQTSLNTDPAVRTESPTRAQSMRLFPTITSVVKDLMKDDSTSTFDTATTMKGQSSTVPYFEKLCWACEELDYPYEYADIVGSQFLGFESASPITHVDGHVPTMEELVEFLALAFICIADFSELTAIFLDDFQWVDSFSWKIFRVACKRVGKILLICATRSHDKQALRRIATAGTTEGGFQSQIIEISLGPLDLADIRELMSRVLGHQKSEIPESVCTDIFQRTGGLPVYVLQLLENIRRKKTLHLVNGILQWTEEGLKQKKNLASEKNAAVMEEAFLSRFDALDVRVRKVLQICAVLGLSFELQDVVRVASPEINERDIESALNTAIDEMILLEQVEDSEDAGSVHTRSVRTHEDSEHGGRIGGSTHQGERRYFQFSHAMWRQNVLSTMLKSRKIELHRRIAESMENDQSDLEQESDISRLLTLFDHWKACGEFSKVAPLALAVGSRLEEWDLSSQSLELYEDALEMAYEGVEESDDQVKTTSDEWVRVKARPVVLDLILRLHVCVGLCYRRLGQEFQSILFFEDAYNIIKTSSKLSSTSKPLNIPIISSLCVFKLALEDGAAAVKTATDLATLIKTFVEEAKAEGNAVHIGRSLAMKASFHAKNGDFREAFDSLTDLDNTMYDVSACTTDMIVEYGRDFVIEGFAESAQWLYLLGLHQEAEKRAEQIIENFVPLLDPTALDNFMYVLFPIIQVFSLLDRSSDAMDLLKKHIIEPFHKNHASCDYWSCLFNPLVYLLQIIIMDEKEERDDAILLEIEKYVLDEKNNDFDVELRRKANTIMGEICWRLVNLHEDEEGSVNDLSREVLEQRAREFLTPVASYEHSELFQKEKAQALLECL